MTEPAGRSVVVEPIVDGPSVHRTRWRAGMGVAGELVITLGVIVLLFAGYELVVTDWESDQAQGAASAELDRQWAAPPPGTPAVQESGAPALRLYVPALGDGWVRTVLQGVGQDVLAKGPGHYPRTAVPGELGNVALAGHRVGHGAPFDAAAELRSCDAMVVETRTTWFVYRLLPLAEERAAWAATARSRPRCRGVTPPGGVYADVVGREIVEPTATDVIAPVPHRPGVAPTLQLLTITTCHPRFSARERMVLHAVLVAAHQKASSPAGWRPAELSEG